MLPCSDDDARPYVITLPMGAYHAQLVAHITLAEQEYHVRETDISRLASQGISPYELCRVVSAGASRPPYGLCQRQASDFNACLARTSDARPYVITLLLGAYHAQLVAHITLAEHEYHVRETDISRLASQGIYSFATPYDWYLVVTLINDCVFLDEHNASFFSLPIEICFAKW